MTGNNKILTNIVKEFGSKITFGDNSKGKTMGKGKIVHDKFDMSMMWELSFFLGLQVRQLEGGTFINQAKYTKELLKKFDMESCTTISTSMSSSIKLDKDKDGCKVDRKSTKGTCQFLGDRLVSYYSKKQTSITTSTAEAEYIVAGSCFAQLLWINNN
ncbi:uncharacterized protein LOC124913277 [Impatiens glandulifera]|uniref:uncharacterized protein LOC124913277 n=1 Tax=Impatiens glandulifera TaxID=253017 RepID=UPI001FB13ADA|nr:uncharacterized protein LOC124913277 [Impatiens glandulifera]